MKILVSIVVLLIAQFAWAGGKVDVTLEVAFPEGRTARPGEIIEANVTMINLGPETVKGVAVGANWPATNGFRTFSIFPVADTFPCTLHYLDIVVLPPGISRESVTIFPGEVGGTLKPNEQVNCVVGISIFPEAPAHIPAFFTVGPLTTDIDPSNNTVRRIIVNGAAAVAVPANGLLSLLALAWLILLAGAWFIRLREKQVKVHT